MEKQETINWHYTQHNHISLQDKLNKLISEGNKIVTVVPMAYNVISDRIIEALIVITHPTFKTD